MLNKGFASILVFITFSSLLILILIINSAISNYQETNSYLIKELEITKLSQQAVEGGIDILLHKSTKSSLRIKGYQTEINFASDSFVVSIFKNKKIVKEIEVKYKFLDEARNQVMVEAQFV